MEIRTIITLTLALICIILLFERFIRDKVVEIASKEVERLVDVDATIKKIKKESESMGEQARRLEELVERVAFERNIFVVKYFKTKEHKQTSENEK